MKFAFSKLEPHRVTAKKCSMPKEEMSGLDDRDFAVFAEEAGLNLDGATELPDDVFSDDEGEVNSPSTTAGKLLNAEHRIVMDKTKRMLWRS